MNHYIAGAICEGWYCTPVLVLGMITFYGFFVFLALIPLYLWFKYRKALKNGEKVKAKMIKKNSLMLFAFIALAIIVGNMINKIYLIITR